MEAAADCHESSTFTVLNGWNVNDKNDWLLLSILVYYDPSSLNTFLFHTVSYGKK